ncbi:NAD(P)/FAD-dependent oxidoreductase [Athalassotoga sp.]|uniref:NAD(P)/FAD-dependent oxidoreductase n=1 Tax=Athalassotoga sp. TaxID=2022597 RepID=UPI003CFEE982
MKIAVVGFGAAAIGFINEVKDKGHEIHVIEKSRDIYSSSISGIRSDGKLFISSSMGGDIEIPLETQKEVVNFYLDKLDESERKDVRTGISFDRKSTFFEKFYSKGFEPVNAYFYHIGTDRLKNLLENIYNEFSSYENIKFHFGIKAENVSFDGNKIKITGSNFEDTFDYVVISVGRSGHGLVKSMTTDHPEIVTSGNIVDVGIRYELPDHAVEELNEEMYEFKVRMRTKTGYMVRTFCNNPSGKVVLEEYDDFVTVNGHSNSNGNSENTNFAVLCSTSFTEPFNDPIGYGTYISKLGNILAGGRKVILQTYGEFLENKRTKRIGRVKPTLSDESYILGDINLVLPRRIAISLAEFIEKLGEVVPAIVYSDNLMYAVEVKFYSKKINNEKYKNLKFIGDCSGHTRSITYATCHGKMLGRSIA